jgi:hypothetical protein
MLRTSPAFFFALFISEVENCRVGRGGLEHVQVLLFVGQPRPLAGASLAPASTWHPLQHVLSIPCHLSMIFRHKDNSFPKILRKRERLLWLGIAMSRKVRHR